MKHTIKHILLVSTFLLTASQAANPADSTSSADINAATAAVPVSVNLEKVYPKLPVGHPLSTFHNNLVVCLTNYDAAEASRARRAKAASGPEAERLTDKVARLNAELSAAEENIRDTTKAFEDVRKNSLARPESLEKFDEREFDKRKEETLRALKQAVDTLKSSAKKANNTVSGEIIEAFLFLARASKFDARFGSGSITSLPHLVKDHNAYYSKKAIATQTEINALLEKRDTPVTDSDNTLKAKEALRKINNELDAKRRTLAEIYLNVPTPKSLLLLIEFVTTMESRLVTPDKSFNSLWSALGKHTECSRDNFKGASWDTELGSNAAAWQNAPFFGNNTLRFLDYKDVIGKPDAPTFQEVLAAAREFAENPKGLPLPETTGTPAGEQP